MQDLWVCYELGEKRDGFFVEFGATNGVKNSNTWLLETKLGWKGILGRTKSILARRPDGQPDGRDREKMCLFEIW